MFLQRLAAGIGKILRMIVIARPGCFRRASDLRVAPVLIFDQVQRLFGPTAIAPDGSVDKVALARRVFSDREARERLEHAIHPLVRARFAEIAGALNGGVAVLEATRLVEAGYAPDFDLIVTVEAPLELRLARAVARGLTEADARARLSAQGDGHLRVRLAVSAGSERTAFYLGIGKGF